MSILRNFLRVQLPPEQALQVFQFLQDDTAANMARKIAGPSGECSTGAARIMQFVHRTARQLTTLETPSNLTPRAAMCAS